MRKIVLDPGHGGSSMGACPPGLVEKELNLIFAQSLESMLRRNFCSSGYDPIAVHSLRQADFDISLNKRGELSAAAKADLVLSIHHNANEQARARGVEFYCDASNRLALDAAAAMASAYPRQLRAKPYPVIHVTGREPTGHWKERPWNVIRPHRKHADVILIEAGYLTNDDDMVSLSSPVIGRHALMAICCGVADWLAAVGEGNISLLPDRDTIMFTPQ